MKDVNTMTIKEANETMIDIDWVCDALNDVYNGSTDESLRIAFLDATRYLIAYKKVIEKALAKVTIEL